MPRAAAPRASRTATAPRARWGGARRGAGRPRLEHHRHTPHRTRPPLSARHPAHVTLRVLPGLPSLRRRRTFRLVQRAFRGGRERFGFRLVHYSVQTNHLHLIVEAADRRALWRGMQGLAIRIARRLNLSLGRHGAVFDDRYFARPLKSGWDVRCALRYVLGNARRHAAQRGRTYPPDWLDPCSTADLFDGWQQRDGRRFRFRPRAHDPPTRVPPRTRLLSDGWRGFGPYWVDAVPGPDDPIATQSPT